MKTLARIVIEHMVFFALCGDETMDSRTANKKLEYATYHLGTCSKEEKQAVVDIITDMRKEALERDDRASIEILDLILENTWSEEDNEETRGA